MKCGKGLEQDRCASSGSSSTTAVVGVVGGIFGYHVEDGRRGGEKNGRAYALCRNANST